MLKINSLQSYYWICDIKSVSTESLKRLAFSYTDQYITFNDVLILIILDSLTCAVNLSELAYATCTRLLTPFVSFQISVHGFAIYSQEIAGILIGSASLCLPRHFMYIICDDMRPLW